jgi:hypothetical protein
LPFADLARKRVGIVIIIYVLYFVITMLSTLKTPPAPDYEEVPLLSSMVFNKEVPTDKV